MRKLSKICTSVMPAAGIFRCFILRVRDHATAEDLTSEVFTRMVKSFHAYRDRGLPFGAWLYRIAHDRAIDYLRHALRHPPVELSETLADPQPGPESQASRRIDADHIAAGLQTLTEDQRLVIQLRFVEGHSLEEVAHLMQRSVGAVKALQHRALQNLASQMPT